MDEPPPREPSGVSLSALSGAALAVVISVPLAAWVAAQLDADYETRAWVYTFAVCWVIAGAVVVFGLTRHGEQQALSPGRVLKWTLSVWLWPLLALRRPRRHDTDQ